jgi:hypothetical protein
MNSHRCKQITFSSHRHRPSSVIVLLYGLKQTCKTSDV